MLQHIFINVLNVLAITMLDCNLALQRKLSDLSVFLAFRDIYRINWSSISKARAMHHVQFNSLNYLSHFDTETVSVGGKLLSMLTGRDRPVRCWLSPGFWLHENKTCSRALYITCTS